MHEVEFQLDQLPRVRDVGKWTVSDTWCHPDRVTAFHVLLLILSGKFQVIEDNTEYVLQRGEVFFLKAGVHHYGLPKTEPGTSWYWVHFYPFGESDGRSSIDINMRTGFYTAEQYARWVTLPKRIQLTDPTDMESRLAYVHRIFGRESNLHRFWVSALFYETLLALVDNAVTLEQRSSRRQHLTAVVQEYIENRFDRDIDSVMISHDLGMNYRYLSTVFKEYTGTTIRGYLNLVRVRQATALLRSTSLNVSEVARQVGFRDPLYFSRIFKREMGLSPSEYRQTLYPPTGVS